MTGNGSANSERLRKERDLYLGLLELNAQFDPEPFLKNALELIVGIVGAGHGYLELFGTEGCEDGWRHAVGFPDEEVEKVRRRISTGIIAEAIASGRVVITPSALLDPRFSGRDSVQQSRIDAVLCAPIGQDPPCGVLYLQSHPVSGYVFPKEEAEQCALFARQLAPLVQQLLQRRRTVGADLTAELRKQLKADSFLGTSRALARVLKEVQNIAHLDIGVLITGQTGTGKTQLAHLIHRNSARSNGPMLELNCATLQDTLVENELFGAAAGGHSTAPRRVEGKVAAAEHGTLLLDEVGELSPSAQAKLLQLLQAREYFPVGSSRPVSADVRIIAATNADLKQAVAERRFREDLYYRLQVIAIHLPALAERPEDVALLARYFCERAQRAHKLSRVELSPAALRALENAEWPGNIRELASKVEGATIKASALGVKQVEVAHLFPDDDAQRDVAENLTFQEETRRYQCQLVSRVLKSVDWNVTAAARRLDLTRSHLYNLIKSFGLSR